MRRIVLLACLFLGACNSPDPIEGRACGAEHECPMGYSCGADGHCIKNGGSATPDATTDATKDGDPLVAEDARAAPDSAAPDAAPSPPDAAAAPDAAAPDAAPAPPDATIAPADAAVDGPVALPETTLTARPDAHTMSSDATLAFTGSPAEATFECALDGAAFTACTSPASLHGLAPGDHAFAVRARTAAGVDASPATASWTIDVATGGPGVTIASGPADKSVSGPAGRFTYEGVPPAAAAGFECALDSATFEPCAAGGFAFAGLADGSLHTFAVHALDAQGRIGAPASRSFTVDAVGPTVTITAPGDGATVGQTVAMTFTYAPETGATFTCRRDAAAATACVSGALWSPLSPGPHTLVVQGTDRLGNVGPPATASFTAVKLSVVTIVAPLPGATTGPSGSFVYDTGDAARVVCTLDGAAHACDLSGSSPFALQSDGDHTFTVQGYNALDEAGPPASVVWSVDAVGPDVVISAPWDLAASTGFDSCADGGVTFQCDEEQSDCPAAAFECSLDGAEFAPCDEGRFDFAFPAAEAEPTHTLAVRARDELGNAGETATVTWEADSYGPEMVVTTPKGTTAGTGRVTFDRDDALPDSISCDVAGSGGFTGSCGPYWEIECACHIFEPCDCFYYEFRDLDDAHNPHVITLGARDECGNEGTASVTWSVDTTGPTITAIVPSGLGQGAATLTATSQGGAQSLSCAMDVADDWHPCTATTVYGSGALSPGEHRFYVKGVDSLGNEGPAASVDFVESYSPALGHAVLIGHDFNERTPELWTLGHDAVSMARFLQLPSPPDRPIRIVAFRAPDLDEDDRINAEEPLWETGELRTFTDASVQGLGDALRGNDVLVVLDMQAPALAASLGQSWKSQLTTFVNRGGVVVVLDGVDGSGNLSRNYRVLRDSGLLPALRDDGAAVVDAGTVTATCDPDDHPLRLDLPASYPAPAHTIRYASDDTHELSVYHACDGSDCRFPVVIDRVLPAPTTFGPVRIGTGLSSPVMGTAFFDDASGAVLAECPLQSDHEVVHNAPRGGFVGAALDWGDSYGLTAFAGVEPLDDLDVGIYLGTKTIAPTDLGDASVKLPGAVAGAMTYYVTDGCPTTSFSSCGSVVAESTSNVTLTNVCRDPINIVVEALDANQRVLAYSVVTGVPLAHTDPIVMPAWQTPNSSFVKMRLGGAPAVSWGSAFFYLLDALPLHFNETPETFCRAGAQEFGDGQLMLQSLSGDVTLPFFSVAGGATNPFTSEHTREVVVFENGAVSSYEARRPAGQAVDLQYGGAFPDALLPSFDVTVGAGGVTLSAPARLADVGGRLSLHWLDEQSEASRSYTLVLPGASRTTVFPTLPDDLTWFDHPGGCEASTYAFRFDESQDANRTIRSYADYRRAYPNIAPDRSGNFVQLEASRDVACGP